MTSAQPRRARTRPAKPHGWRRALIIAVVSLLALGGLAVAGIYAMGVWADRQIERFGDPFEALDPAKRPEPAPAPEDEEGTTAVNILILGSDSRISAGDPGSWEQGAQRTDAIMIAHLNANRQNAYVMSIPRDSWVEIPGHGEAKINAAYSLGGPTLMIETVEDLTGIRIDHFAVADFESFTSLTNALGGVEIEVPEDTYQKGELLFTAGTHLMDGEEALAYTRQRYGLEGGDFDRIKRQQNWLRAVVKKASKMGAFTNPIRRAEMMDALGESIAVDDALDRDKMTLLARGTSHLTSPDMEFVTIPTLGTGWSPDGKQSIVVVDHERLEPLAKAFATDRVTKYLKKNLTKLDFLQDEVR
ncbi:transcriptional regulator [Flavimobilis marinus]|uniref:Transcriptional attenuator, LytR family n=1 Tax=Flavimobilis marinus TaxID=285351 RepID=A0A1I2GN84_9MICO|nr:LCP family protein [Flavimobilis marinus]GHG56068.1 transcriptional regulator [Flavimobilis marinus]SFF18287.1 transcriptional attenuator, LytR family [Flavimobilis marinus]